MRHEPGEHGLSSRAARVGLAECRPCVPGLAYFSFCDTFGIGSDPGLTVTVRLPSARGRLPTHSWIERETHPHILAAAPPPPSCSRVWLPSQIDGVSFSHLVTNHCVTRGRCSKLLRSLREIHEAKKIPRGSHGEVGTSGSREENNAPSSKDGTCELKKQNIYKPGGI